MGGKAGNSLPASSRASPPSLTHVRPGALGSSVTNRMYCAAQPRYSTATHAPPGISTVDTDNQKIYFFFFSVHRQL